MRFFSAGAKWLFFLGELWLFLSLTAAFWVWLDNRRSGAGYSFFYTPGLTTALQLAALLLVWLLSGLMLLRLGRRK